MGKNYFHAIATLSGTIIGAGMFAVPFVVSQAGLAPLFFLLPLLAIIQYTLHSLYAEIVMSCPSRHRMPGYVGTYIGPKAKKATLAISLIGKHGALLAYIILGGVFLYELLNPVFGGSVFAYTAALFVLEAVIVYVGLRLIASVEFLMTGALLLVIVLIGWKSMGAIEAANYFAMDWAYALLPYGPIFFAVGGQAAIPDVCKLLEHNKTRIKSAIAWGTFVPAFLTLLFAIVVVGVTGPATTQDTLSGLHQMFDNGVITFALLFGLFSVVTSFLVICQSMREVYWWDLGMNRSLAWALACLVPFLLFAVGLRDFAGVIGLTGSIIGGVFGIVLIFLLFQVRQKRKNHPEFRVRLNRRLAYIMSLFFVFGLLYEIWAFFVH